MFELLRYNLEIEKLKRKLLSLRIFVYLFDRILDSWEWPGNSAETSELKSNKTQQFSFYFFISKKQFCFKK